MKKSVSNGVKWEPYLFLTPFMVLFLVFFLFPIVFSIVISFTDWSGMGKMNFIGLDNYAFILSGDDYFWSSVRLTAFTLVFGFLAQHLIAVPLAVLLNTRGLKGRSVFQFFYFVPYIVSAVSITLMIQNIMSKDYGILNYLLGLFGQPRIGWFSTDMIPISISLVVNWRTIGFNIILYLAALQSIDPALYEAADMDGATFYVKHRSITLPAILPFIFFAITISIINGMQIFDEPYSLVNPFVNAPAMNKAGLSVTLYVIWLLKKAGKWGRGNAVAWLLFAVIFVFNLVNRRISRHFDEE
jgi:ABC-type sugar transport system permease subunit